MNVSVIWDWNGTLLDDVDICIASANELLERRGLPEMTLERYRRMFGFPVQDYYQEMGFDFSVESFSDVAEEFHHSYGELVRGTRLHPDALPVLEALHERGVRQVILSALEEERLLNELQVRGIGHYFDKAFGLSDLHARSKSDRGRELLAELGSDGAGWWLIGDTGHDAEVAADIGVSCILVACGHYSEDRLRSTGAPVAANLTDVLEILGAN